MPADPYLQEDGATLRNKLGINRDPEKLEARISALTALRIQQIKAGRAQIEQTFDATHLRALHAFIFQDVFEWAGTFRGEEVCIDGKSVQLKGTMNKAGSRTSFADTSQILPELQRTAGRIRKDNNLRGLSRDAFAVKAALVLTEINAAHPFREGNGRVQRVFMEQLAEQAGHKLDFTVVSQERMYRDSEASMGSRHARPNPLMMQRLVREIADPDRCAMLKRVLTSLERSNVDWNDLYCMTAEPGSKYRGLFKGMPTGAEQFLIQADNADLIVGRAADCPAGVATNEDVVFLASSPEAAIAPAHRKPRSGTKTGRDLSD